MKIAVGFLMLWMLVFSTKISVDIECKMKDTYNSLMISLAITIWFIEAMTLIFGLKVN